MVNKTIPGRRWGRFGAMRVTTREDGVWAAVQKQGASLCKGRGLQKLTLGGSVGVPYPLGKKCPCGLEPGSMTFLKKAWSRKPVP